MKSYTSLAIAALVAAVTAQPLVEPRDTQVAHLTLHAAPVSYNLAVPSDGTVVKTSKRAIDPTHSFQHLTNLTTYATPLCMRVYADTHLRGTKKQTAILTSTSSTRRTTTPCTSAPLSLTRSGSPRWRCTLLATACSRSPWARPACSRASAASARACPRTACVTTPTGSTSGRAAAGSARRHGAGLGISALESQVGLGVGQWGQREEKRELVVITVYVSQEIG